MTTINVEDLTTALGNTCVSENGVSVQGKSLKLDSEEDTKEIIEKIKECSQLQFLNLEGNTLGVEAAKFIGQALEEHPEFKRALWKDLFTGRMKTEIPKALEHLGNGLVTAGARLTELDLSDNAFGPIGVEGLASLLRSSSCYSLEELRLNNNGLGITGGKLLASALTDCYNFSKIEGKPLPLRVFIAGRNRLENEGAKALSEVFKLLGTLEELAMPQNGIYHVGMTALSEALKTNRNLKILNLNDNTVGHKGALALSQAFPVLQKLQKINFGDCLLKTKGAQLLAKGLAHGHSDLEELEVGFNEIKIDGAIDLIKAMENKKNLKVLGLNGNQFAEKGRNKVESYLKNIGKFDAMGSLSQDESEDSEESDAEVESEESSESEDEETKVVAKEKTPTKVSPAKVSPAKVTVEEFVKNPTEENFIGLGDSPKEVILTSVTRNGNIDLDSFIPVLMKISALSQNPKTAKLSCECAQFLYQELFTWAQKQKNLTTVNNSLLVNLSLIKSEDKKFKPSWNVKPCIECLETVLQKNYVPETSKQTLQAFIKKKKGAL